MSQNPEITKTKNIENEIKSLNDLDKSKNGKKKYHFIKLKNSLGQYTKKALDFNKKMIKEGKTFNYLDNTKIVNRKVNPDGSVRLYFTNVKYDKRFKNKKVPLKKFKNLDLMGSIQLKGNIKNKTEKEYMKNLKKELLKKSKGGSVKVDLTKISLKKLLNLLINTPSEPNVLRLGIPQGSKNIIALSNFNIDRLNNYDSLMGDNFSKRAGSDNQFIFELDSNPILNIVFKKTEGKPKPSGAFFNYYLNNIGLDLSRYGIFNGKTKYQNNCLYEALKYGGLEIEKLNDLRIFVRSGNVPTCKLMNICEKLGIKITLRKLKKDNTIVTLHFGNEGKNYNIGLLDNHFFIYEKTDITSWSLKNYESIKDKNFWWRKCIKGNPPITSFKVIKFLLENKETFLKPVPMEDIMDCQYFNDMINNDDLTYDIKKCLDENKPLKEIDRGHKVYFDFETNTTTETHTPYLMCALSENNIPFSSIGSDCGDSFVSWIKMMYGKGEPDKSGCINKIQLIAHNLRYDYTFIFDKLFCLKPIMKGNNVMGGSGRVYVGKSTFIEISFLDSCNMITTKLSKFGEMFQLEQSKEIMPYSLYTTENIEDRFIDIETCLSFVKEDDKEQYLKNCKMWNCIEDDEIDILDYSKRYCQIDCKVLKEGLETFSKWIKEITGLDIYNYCSIASVGLDYLIVNGCFEGCFKMCGRPREFIQRCVVGGRTMTRDNKKWKVSGKIDDFDAVGLYNTSMNRMKGFLGGVPKVIENKSFDWLNKNSDGFFVKVLCLNEPVIKRGFPLLSQHEGEVRNFTNNTKGNYYYIDKTTYEDCVKYQGLEFKIICGYYYNEGHNNKINKVVEHLFNARLEAKKNKNPIQVIYKLLMNSCYGKCLLKPIDTDLEIVYQDKFEDYLTYNYNFIKDIVDCGKLKIVKKIKPINEHFNNVYAGVEILSMSKRIMNEVICLGEDLGLNIYYQDTDSLHINSSEIKTLSSEFKKIHGRELIGKGMGQFHSDFDLDGASKNIHAVNSVFLGKKCYIDELVGEDEKGKIIKGFHVRMKGINNEGIMDYTKKYNTDLMSVYNELYENNELPEKRKFDLLAGGKCVKFKYNSDMSVSSVGEFMRGVNFDYEKGILQVH